MSSGISPVSVGSVTLHVIEPKHHISLLALPVRNLQPGDSGSPGYHAQGDAGGGDGDLLDADTINFSENIFLNVSLEHHDCAMSIYYVY